jgi:flavin-binding protein dodecin
VLQSRRSIRRRDQGSRQAAKSLRDLRVAEVSELDLTLEDGKVKSYRGKVKLSLKYENRG